MINYHPEDDLLLKYSAGSLEEGWSLVVATHLSLCPLCREFVSVAEHIGGALIDSLVPESVSDSTLENVLMNLDDEEIHKEEETKLTTAVLPSPLRKYINGDLDDVKWDPIMRGVSQYILHTNDQTTARLLSIPANIQIPEHHHKGREMTLVLTGGFSDHTGDYIRGDLEDVEGSLTHSPTSNSSSGCICLVVTEAPVYFHNFIPRLLQPFIRI